MVPFNDAAAGKDRPVIVLGWSLFTPRDDHNILVVPVSSFGGDASKARDGDLQIANPTRVGLSTGSFARCRRLHSLHPDALRLPVGPLGTIDGQELNAILTEVAKMFSGSSMLAIPYGT
jgi:mRNA-degrading endonuclease toxin of MazEF toxin-antitoxin module